MTGNSGNIIDTNLVPGNIKVGETIFGVQGNFVGILPVVTFDIKDGDGVTITGCTLTFNSVVYSAGTTKLSIANGTYSYTIGKDGRTHTGSAVVSGDTTVTPFASNGTDITLAGGTNPCSPGDSIWIQINPGAVAITYLWSDASSGSQMNIHPLTTTVCWCQTTHLGGSVSMAYYTETVVETATHSAFNIEGTMTDMPFIRWAQHGIPTPTLNDTLTGMVKYGNKIYFGIGVGATTQWYSYDTSTLVKLYVGSMSVSTSPRRSFVSMVFKNDVVYWNYQYDNYGNIQQYRHELDTTTGIMTDVSAWHLTGSTLPITLTDGDVTYETTSFDTRIYNQYAPDYYWAFGVILVS